MLIVRQIRSQRINAGKGNSTCLNNSDLEPKPCPYNAFWPYSRLRFLLSTYYILGTLLDISHLSFLLYCLYYYFLKNFLSPNKTFKDLVV